MLSAKQLGFCLFVTMFALSQSFRLLSKPSMSTISRSTNVIRSLCMAGEAIEVKNMDVKRFALILNSEERENYQIVDVREPNELEVASIKESGIINIPLGDAASWQPKLENGELLDQDKPVICMCHHGMRSMKMAMFLGRKGFTTYNVQGGIHAYSEQIDPSVPMY